MNGQIIRVCDKIFALARNSLTIGYKFLGGAIGYMDSMPLEEMKGVGTNGKDVVYNPMDAINEYKNGNFSRIYFHMVLHCLFNHLFNIVRLEPRLWDLATDIAVESVILELGDKFSATGADAREENDANCIKAKLGYCNAEKIYAWLKSGAVAESEIARLESLFKRDDHRLWREEEPQDGSDGESKNDDDSRNGDGSRNKKNDSSDGEDDPGNGEDEPSNGEDDQGNSEDDSGNGEDDSGNGKDDSSDGEDDSGGMGGSGKNEDDSGGNDDESNDGGLKRNSGARDFEFWEKAGIQADLEITQFLKGDLPGSLMENLKSIKRDTTTYTDFIRQFMVFSEEMLVNDDEFDYIFYTYGLGLYKKMPLIEPLEYKEINMVKDFVVAIDTSGSCSGWLVQKFVSKTCALLQSEQISNANVHIIQCDARIQSDLVIRNQEDFERLKKNGIELRGFGGTDFRPVFDYVLELEKNGDITDLKGIVYFTDGMGDFPSHPPTCKTAFVFVEDPLDSVDLPPWAIKFVMNKDDLD